jgi:hypothetical protein
VIKIPITSENYDDLGIIYNRYKLKKGKFDRNRRWKIWKAILSLNHFPIFYDELEPQLPEDIAQVANMNVNTAVSLLNYYCKDGRCEKRRMMSHGRGRPRTGYVVSAKILAMFEKMCRVDNEFRPENFEPPLILRPCDVIKLLEKHSKEELIELLQKC